MGTLLVPLSVGSIGWALEHPEHTAFVAVGSIFIFSFWVYVSRLYRESAASTRKILMAIEREWGIEEGLALYKTHGNVGTSRYGLFRTQLFCLAVLTIVWLVVLFLLEAPLVSR